MQEIIIEVDVKGNTTIDGKGFTGTECTDLTKPIEDALNGEIVERLMKPESRQTRTATQKVGGGR